ncbi:hypothetical protein AB0C10_16375 [Microbispora amethystogenes]|uniref:hypothetical protein n=1 Tax=Microbispora amethystogenes TaxID=1427754 RepID=UPI0033E35529
MPTWAAHAMSPDRGQGAGQSIEDAVVLAAALAPRALGPLWDWTPPALHPSLT